MDFWEALKIVRDHAEAKWKNVRTTGYAKAQQYLILYHIANRILAEKEKEC
jgi:hypothetical protein